ncbi:MAG: hypothetical protein LBJ15_19750 [Comamonas sp.]|jgi:hypothetical protein|uniref:hypothetical protein n=1 Tax=Comamonas sp. TaxID=34028 RepID=UPI00282D982A|nr:hypothetical protein [Comamonas sp.]MDR0216211.1 hypothetical protein [Comamonas sp.]
MTLEQIIKTGIAPAMALLPAGMDSQRARVMLLAIGLQESRFEHRRQLVGSPPRPIGPAKSFWQAEQGGGMVHGVRLHDKSRAPAATLYAARGVVANDAAIWNAIEQDDVLAAGLARLLLWTDPKPLPAVEDEASAWQLYLRTWRPGAWERGNAQQRADLRAKWARNHAQARAALEVAA